MQAANSAVLNPVYVQFTLEQKCFCWLLISLAESMYIYMSGLFAFTASPAKLSSLVFMESFWEGYCNVLC